MQLSLHCKERSIFHPAIVYVRKNTPKACTLCICYLKINKSLIRDTKALLNMYWHVQVSHIYGEANYAADFMAACAANYPLGYHVIIEPPIRIFDILFNDCTGAAVRRTVVV